MKSRWLWIILAVALTLRVALLAAAWHEPNRLLMPDSWDYIRLSHELLRDGTFTQLGQPEIFRTPGYPLLLTAAMLPAGEAGQIHIAACIQIALDVLLVYFTFLLGQRFGGQAVGLLAASFQAVAVVAITSSVRILSDTPFAVMLVGALLLLVRHFDTGRWRPLLASAVLAAVACYVRPVGLVFCVLAVGVMLLKQRRLRTAAAFAGIAVAIILPWVVRNATQADYVGFSSFATDSMYFYSAPKTIGQAEEIPLDDARVALDCRLMEDKLDALCFCCVRENEFVQTRARLAREAIFAHPFTYAKIHLLGCTAFWIPAVHSVMEILGLTVGQSGTLQVLHTRGPVAAAVHYLNGQWWTLWLVIPATIGLAIKYVLVGACLLRRVRWRMSAAGWLILLTVLAFSLVGGPGAIPRYRVPVEPLLSAAAAWGLVWMGQALRRRRKTETW